MSAPNAVTELVGRGRRRQVWHLLVQGTSVGLAVLLAGFFFLLILGTQILNWYWLVILFAAGLVAGSWRARSTVHTPYQIAQEIDSRLGLYDAISTAYFFDIHPDRTDSPAEIVEYQRAHAAQLARTADLGRGLPFIMPRTAYLNAALSIAVFAMFGLRYGMTHSMDLRASLVPASFDGFFTPSRQIAKIDRRTGGMLPVTDDGRDAQGLPSEPTDTQQDMDQPSNPNQDAQSSPADKAGSKTNSKNGAPDGKQDQPEGQDPMNSAGKNDGQKGNPQASDKDGNTPGDQAKGNDSKNGAQSGSGNGENSSLADKMKDALSSLLSKLKPQSNPSQGSPQQQNGNQGSQQKGQQAKDSKGKGDQGDQQSDANDGNDSQAGQESANAPQQGAQGQSASNNPSPDGSNGIGKQDGDKSAREAAQQAAMGKISEILGKRAANINGDVMVEVAPGKQQLKTQYSQRSATHTDAGGEVNRDEIPLAYQHYIEQYFEQVRKSPSDKGKLDPKAKGSGN